ncbi:MAG: hypothetical protein HY784_02900 [Chloroflexi bacterium]|nr:hypothetical protein [Chloroflexota bacterium]
MTLVQFTTPALVGLLITAALLVVTTDWRLGFGALAAQYGLAVVLVAQIVVWQVAAVKVLVGLLVICILVVTGREVNFGRKASPTAPEAGGASPRFEFPTNFPFRALAAAMMVVAAWSTASQPDFAWPGLPLGLNIASYLLVALGLLNLGLTEEPMNAGMGLLTLLTGFEMLYAAVEPSLAIVALLAAVDFGVALAVSYLALLRYAAADASRELSP